MQIGRNPPPPYPPPEPPPPPPPVKASEPRFIGSKPIVFAFPRPLPRIVVSPDEAHENIMRYAGMELRDYFAGKTIEGMFAMAAHPESTGIDPHEYEKVARDAYAMADELMKARER